MTVILVIDAVTVSTHSRAEAAALHGLVEDALLCVSTHSRAEAAAHHDSTVCRDNSAFQHTAAQRRLLFNPRI